MVVFEARGAFRKKAAFLLFGDKDCKIHPLFFFFFFVNSLLSIRNIKGVRPKTSEADAWMGCLVCREFPGL